MMLNKKKRCENITSFLVVHLVFTSGGDSYVDFNTAATGYEAAKSADIITASNERLMTSPPPPQSLFPPVIYIFPHLFSLLLTLTKIK